MAAPRVVGFPLTGRRGLRTLPPGGGHHSPRCNDPPGAAGNGARGVNAKQARRGNAVLWSLWHYAWVVVVCTLLGAAVPFLLPASTPTYQADALVVARQVSVNTQVLGDLAQSVFNDGTVAAQVATDPAVRGLTGSLIPDKVNLVAGQNTIVLDVQGFDSQPAVAARLANEAAAAFVVELNKAGSGVGQFVVQAEAGVPSAPVWVIGTSLWAGAGAIVGLLLGLGLVALLGAIRRPMVSGDEVQDAVGVPLLGTVRLPLTRRRTYPGPLGVPGIATVSRWLAQSPSGRLLFVSERSDGLIRDRVFVMSAVTLWTVRTIRLQAPDQIVEAVRQHCAQLRDLGRTPPGERDAEGELVLVDGSSPLDMLDAPGAGATAVAIARRGVGRRRLQALTGDYAGTDRLLGVVLVDARLGLGSGRRPKRAGSVHPASSAPPETPEPQPETQPETQSATHADEVALPVSERA